jgi:hypothetical protein
MSVRTGSADLPLHGGRVPAWLATRMAQLGRLLVETLVLEYGRDEVLRRLSNPFWFQALGAVMGMDWHSSGITTSVLGALKRGLGPVAHELGIYVCGGRGRHSRQTPAELAAVGERTGIDGAALARTSRLVAKVDSAAVQDGFDLYLHGFVVTADGHWTVVQQGMNGVRKQARRYHWSWERVASGSDDALVDQPHAAIEGPGQGMIVNLTDRRAGAARAADLALVHAGPDLVTGTLQRLPHLSLPAHHDVRADNLNLVRLAGALRVAATHGPASFPELLLVPGIGARTLFALSLVAEVVHGVPSRFEDPARFSLAHGGKDGHPFPVPLAIYDQTLRVFRTAVAQAKLGNQDKLAAIRRLDDQSRLCEAAAAGQPLPSLSALVAAERPRWGHAPLPVRARAS